jgi:SNF2 family DNA or RNA helicase
MFNISMDWRGYLNSYQLDYEETLEGFRTPIIQFVSLDEFIEQIGGMREVNSEYQRFLDEITDFKSDENFKLPIKMESALISNDIKLRPYQRAGIHWLSWLLKHHLNGILADDMGLGKTIQTISTIGMLYHENKILQHSLIICPKSVVPFWAREIKRCSPDLRIYEYVGSLRNKNCFNNNNPLIFITTYETASKDIDIIRSIPFYCVVLDEATKIKNPSSQRSKSIKEINAVHRLALSGTPIENRPAELWSLFDFLMKGHLGTHGNFIRKFEVPINGGDDDTADHLSKRIRPFILRRLKKDVAKDLPEKIEMHEMCNLTVEQKSIYGQIQDRDVSSVRNALISGEIINNFHILTILTKLKQVCDHPALITGIKDVIEGKEPIDGRSEKFDLVIDKVIEIRKLKEHVVLFSHFLNTLNLFEIAFKSRGITYIRIDGSDSMEDRQKKIDKFNLAKDDVALCSIKSCGQGITLTAANHVIHIDRWWNPAIEDQATDRVHRIGQDKTVYVYTITNTGTLEEKIALLLEKKRNISDKIIGGAIRQKMEWTREELLELLKPLE